MNLFRFVLSSLFVMTVSSAAAINTINNDEAQLPLIRRKLGMMGIGANQGSARKIPRGKKELCDVSNFVPPLFKESLKEIGSATICNQEVIECLWYIGLREINCQCGEGIPCPEQGEEFCLDGFVLTKGIGGGSNANGTNGLRFWVCDLIEPEA